MKLHTDTLTTTQIFDALFAAKNEKYVAESVYFDVLDQKGSRSKDHAFEIQLSSTGKIEGDKRRFKNSGTNGAGEDYSATYDEWGFFLSAIFELDPEAVVGFYKSEEHFHTSTREVYRDAYNWGVQSVINRMPR